MKSSDIINGLKEAVEHEKGSIKLRTVKATIKPLEKFGAPEIKAIRTKLGMSQSSFAGCIGVSQKTIEAWEAGRNSPNGPASRILWMLQVDPELPVRYGILEQTVGVDACSRKGTATA